jgi:hypothetical protein
LKEMAMEVVVAVASMGKVRGNFGGWGKRWKGNNVVVEKG